MLKVMVVVFEDPPKKPAETKLAEMTLLPGARELPFSVLDAVAWLPRLVEVTVARTFAPREKTTLP